MNCSSSRSGTNVSCLRSSRRRMLLSFSTTPRAESGSKRINADTVLRVLNRKCGLIWLESASMRAFSKSCWWRSRFISMRVLFQIFSGAATDISVAITVSPSHQFQCASIAKSHFGFVARTSATRPSSRPTHTPNGAISHDNSALRSSFTVALGMFKNVNGPKFHRSSLLGIACRINPPSKPAVDAAGMASHSCEISAGMVIIAPPIGPTTRPPSSPIRNAPSSDKSANAYGGPPTSRSVTPTISAGVMNNISLSFWSGSRCSVKSTRRNVFHLARSAEMDDATPTFSSRVNNRSRTDVAVSILCCALRLTLINPLLDVKRGARAGSRAANSGHGGDTWQGTQKAAGTPSLLYCSFPDERKIKARQEKSHHAGNGRARRAANALWTLYHLWLQGARSAGRGGRAGSRQLERKNRSPGARPLAVPDWRRSRVSSV